MSTLLRERPGSRQPGLLLHAPRRRPLRFALTGGSAALVQLVLLHALEVAGAPALVANALGFLVAAQLNFTLSQVFTWADRPADPATGSTLPHRWVRFHLAIAATALLNMLVFWAAHPVVPDVLASALGIGVAALANFLLGDRLVFR